MACPGPRCSVAVNYIARIPAEHVCKIRLTQPQADADSIELGRAIHVVQVLKDKKAAPVLPAPDASPCTVAEQLGGGAAHGGSTDHPQVENFDKHASPETRPRSSMLQKLRLVSTQRRSWVCREQGVATVPMWQPTVAAGGGHPAGSGGGVLSCVLSMHLTRPPGCMITPRQTHCQEHDQLTPLRAARLLP